MKGFSKASRDVFDEDDYAILNDDFKKPMEKPKPKLEGIGLAGFLIMMTAIPLWWWIAMIIGLAASIVSLIFGIIGMARGYRAKNKGKFKGRGFAIVSFILSVLVILVSIAVLAVLI